MLVIVASPAGVPRVSAKRTHESARRGSAAAASFAAGGASGGDLGAAACGGAATAATAGAGGRPSRAVRSASGTTRPSRQPARHTAWMGSPSSMRRNGARTPYSRYVRVSHRISAAYGRSWPASAARANIRATKLVPSALTSADSAFQYQ